MSIYPFRNRKVATCTQKNNRFPRYSPGCGSCSGSRVGCLEVVPLSDLPLEPTDETVACAASLQGLLPRRPFDAHKNQFGRVGIVAGSRGFAGAAAMCAW